MLTTRVNPVPLPSFLFIFILMWMLAVSAQPVRCSRPCGMRGGEAMADRGEEEEEVGQTRGVFDIPNKRASNSSLERWRKVVIVRNALRRFRYTANIKKREEIVYTKRQLRVALLATKAALILLRDPHPHPPYEPTDGFGVHYKTLMEMLGNKDSFVKLGKAEGIANRLTVSLSDGILGTEDDVKARVNAFGQHVYKESPPRGFWLFVWEAFQDITLLILIVCALVSLAVGIPTEGFSQGWYDGGGILFSIFIIVFVTAISDYRQSLQFEELELEKKKVYLQVVRRGRRQKVLIHDLLVGDVVHLSIGDIVPADGIYVDGYSLEIDSSSLTGESDPIYPTLEKPFLYGGTAVKDGSARMVVTAVGMNTQWGQVLSSLSRNGDLDETPLQVKLNGVATLVGLIGMGFAVLTFIALIVRFLYAKPSYFHWSLNDLNTILNYFAIGVTIVVVAVPEGLPLAVTLSLAYAMRQMMNDKALVRRLSACETMGSATTICSDKTGTLTTNSMEVSKVWLGGESHTIGTNTLNLTSSLRDLTLEGIFQNTSGDVDEHSHSIKFLGSPTESAFLKFGYSLGGCFREIRSMSEIVQVEPFNSIKKWMGVVVKTPENKYRAYSKGAAEITIKSCDSFIDSTGKRVSMDDFYRHHVSEIIERFSKEALRTLCLVFKDLDHVPPKNAFPERGFTCVGIFGIKDPVRPGVRDAVNLCSKAGIKVRMVTGDSVETAKAIAQECGILTHNGIVVEGHVFRTWSEAEMDENVPRLQVMARSLPQDKLLLVKRLKKLGEVVAVTGDGTNDAPALYESDIGLSMGISGTEVAKNSSDIVILDDNFSTVVNVAKWGRSVYTNVQKFVQFQLTVNLVALAVNFISACLAGKAPLTAVQLLWVNLIMDTMGALALATEPPYDALMEKKAVGRKQEFITNIMWRNIVGQAIYQLAVLLVLQYQGKELLNLTGINADEKLDTIIFNAFVFCQVFNELNCREMEKLNVFRHTLNNSIFIGVVTGTVVFQVIIVEFLGKFTSTVPLNKEEWLFSVLIGFVTIFVAFFVKFIPVPSRPFYELFQKPIQSKDPITERLLADDAC